MSKCFYDLNLIFQEIIRCSKMLRGKKKEHFKQRKVVLVILQRLIGQIISCERILDTRVYLKHFNKHIGSQNTSILGGENERARGRRGRIPVSSKRHYGDNSNNQKESSMQLFFTGSLNSSIIAFLLFFINLLFINSE